MPNKKYIILILLVVILAGLAFWDVQNNLPQQNNQVACTMDAKQCPDGSYVGRTGPKCEFAACPAVSSTSLPSLKTFSDTAKGFSFQYPEKLSTSYMHALDWPPAMQIYTGPFLCEAAGSENVSGGKTEERIIGGRTFCVTLESEGAAGSIYNQYAYKTTENNKLVIFTFSIQAVQCGNYDEPKKTECEKERATFNIDSVVNQIVNTLKITTAQPAVKKSGIKGTVSLGPTCPVMKNPPDPACADKPYAVKLQLVSSGGSFVIKEFSSNTDGTFSVEIPPGEYLVRSAPTMDIYPICRSSNTVVVNKGAYTNVDISCDTGIR